MIMWIGCWSNYSQDIELFCGRLFDAFKAGKCIFSRGGTGRLISTHWKSGLVYCGIVHPLYVLPKKSGTRMPDSGYFFISEIEHRFSFFANASQFLILFTFTHSELSRDVLELIERSWNESREPVERFVTFRGEYTWVCGWSVDVLVKNDELHWILAMKVHLELSIPVPFLVSLTQWMNLFCSKQFYFFSVGKHAILCRDARTYVVPLWNTISSTTE